MLSQLRFSYTAVVDYTLLPDIRSEFKGKCSRAYFFPRREYTKNTVISGCYASFDKAFLFVASSLLTTFAAKKLIISKLYIYENEI